jgi:hypothetical protein
MKFTLRQLGYFIAAAKTSRRALPGTDYRELHSRHGAARSMPPPQAALSAHLKSVGMVP